MSETEYTVTTTRHRSISGRMNSGGYTATITGPADFHLDSPRFDTDAAAQEWAAKFVAAKTAGLVQTPQPKAPATARATTRPQVDRQAARVADFLGLPAPKATGRCHYCNLPLTNGVCDECV